MDKIMKLTNFSAFRGLSVRQNGAGNADKPISFLPLPKEPMRKAHGSVPPPLRHRPFSQKEVAASILAAETAKAAKNRLTPAGGKSPVTEE